MPPRTPVDIHIRTFLCQRWCHTLSYRRSCLCTVSLTLVWYHFAAPNVLTTPIADWYLRLIKRQVKYDIYLINMIMLSSLININRRSWFRISQIDNDLLMVNTCCFVGHVNQCILHKLLFLQDVTTTTWTPSSMSIWHALCSTLCVVTWCWAAGGTTALETASSWPLTTSTPSFTSSRSATAWSPSSSEAWSSEVRYWLIHNEEHYTTPRAIYTYTAFRKYSDPLSVTHFVTKWIQFFKILSNLHIVPHNDEVRTGFSTFLQMYNLLFTQVFRPFAMSSGISCFHWSSLRCFYNLIGVHLW